MTAAAELFDRRVAPGQALGADAELVALACHDMARRFAGGGKLVVFGSGAAATDAQHLAVEFVHPGHRRQAGLPGAVTGRGRGDADRGGQPGRGGRGLRAAAAAAGRPR